MITGARMLAKISSTPGKTRLINHFLINDEWYLVDLPGYGYAKVGRKTREKWQRHLEIYLINRPNLMSTFILVDSRHELQDNDRQVMSWFGENKLPFAIVFTKSDKLNSAVLAQNIRSYKESLSEDWEELPPVMITSSYTRLGREEILNYISETNEFFQGQR